MKKLIFIVLLIVGCDNSTEPEVQWVCKVKPDYDGPLPVELLESATDTTTIYSSYEGCDSDCVRDLYEGPGENLYGWPYYCKEIN